MFKGKFVFSVFVSFLILTAFASVSAARIIYVPDDYAKIQWAVDNATAGDTIIVRDGIYVETVNVSKPLTLKSENGSANCIVDAGGNESAITLSADGITLDGFTVTNTSWKNVTLSNNTFLFITGKGGIYVCSNNNKILNNNALNNSYNGIDLRYSSNNTLSNNNASNNYHYGINLRYSSNNMLSNNSASNNGYNGIYLYSSSNNTLSNNNALNNYFDGVCLYSSSNNMLLNNNVLDNNIGIALHCSGNNTLSNNNISNNFGIWLYYSSNNILLNNNISNNSFGVFLSYSSDNNIYLNNFINNTKNAYSYDSTNIWNSTEPIKYTYKGSNFTNYMGNYWDNYNGSDANRDGLGDTAHMIPSLYDKDYHPLIEKFENYIVAEKEEREAPGFEAFFAIAELLAVVYLLIRRK